MASGLNAGQQAASDGFLSFLFGNDKEMIISGPGGSGKTHLMGVMIDTVMPLYEKTAETLGEKTVYHSVNMVATTHKAAEALASHTHYETGTIHSLLGLTLKPDFKTGTSSLVRKRNSEPVNNQIIFCDEASFVDGNLYRYANIIPYQCKIVWVMDHCQIPPVAGKIAVEPNSSRKMYELTEPMRNASQPALVKLCHEMRESIRNNTATPKIELVKGVVDLFTGPQFKEFVDNHFKDPDNPVTAKILGYTNACVHGYNMYIRGLRNLPPHFTVGEKLVSNGMLTVADDDRSRILARTEQEVTITEMGEPTTMVIDSAREASLNVRFGSFINSLGESASNVPFVEDREHYNNMLKYFVKVAKETHDWSTYYRLKDCFPDFRDNNASTTHKAQGSTYDIVLICLDDLAKCFQSVELLKRLLYVAVSRARHRVIFYGTLPKALETCFYGDY